jgi:hypothetical protein
LNFSYRILESNQDTFSNVPGPQDGGFDTSAWGNYTNYYPIQQRDNSNNYSHARGNQRPRSNNQRQPPTNNNVIVRN